MHMSHVMCMCPHLAFACATTIFVTYRESSVECQCVRANFGRIEFVYIAFPAASRAFHALPPFTLYDMVYMRRLTAAVYRPGDDCYTLVEER